jgi:hypothetical protein
MPRRNLPPLEVGTAYLATDFEMFEYWSDGLPGSETILRLHLKNATTIDLPSSKEELQRLMLVLIDANGPVALDHLVSRGWAKKP